MDSARDAALGLLGYRDICLVLLVSLVGLRGDDQVWLRLLLPVVALHTRRAGPNAEPETTGVEWCEALAAKIHPKTIAALLTRLQDVVATAEDMRRHLVEFGEHIARHGRDMRFERRSYLGQLIVQTGRLVGLMDLTEVTAAWRQVQAVLAGMRGTAQAPAPAPLSRIEKALEKTMQGLPMDNKLPPMAANQDEIARGADLKTALVSTALRLANQRHMGPALETLYHAFVQERKELMRKLNEELRQHAEQAARANSDAAKLAARVARLMDSSAQSNFDLIELTVDFLLNNDVPEDEIPPALRVSATQLQQSLALNATSELDRVSASALLLEADSPQAVAVHFRQLLPNLLAVADAHPAVAAGGFFDTAQLYWMFGYGSLFAPYMELALDLVPRNDEDHLAEIALFTAVEIDVFTAWGRTGCSTARELIAVLARVKTHDTVLARKLLAAFVHNHGPVERLPVRYADCLGRAEVLLLRFERRAYAAFVAAKRHAERWASRASHTCGVMRREAAYLELVYTALGVRCLLDSTERKHHVYAHSHLERGAAEASRRHMVGLELEFALLRTRFHWIRSEPTEAALRTADQLRRTVASPRLEVEYCVLANEPPQTAGGLRRCLYTELDPQLATRMPGIALHRGFSGVADLLGSENVDTDLRRAFLDPPSRPTFIRPPLPLMSTPTPGNRTQQPVDISRISCTPLAGEESGKRSWPSSGSPERPESKRRSVSFGVESSRLDDD